MNMFAESVVAGKLELTLEDGSKVLIAPETISRLNKLLEFKNSEIQTFMNQNKYNFISKARDLLKD